MNALFLGAWLLIASVTVPRHPLMPSCARVREAYAKLTTSDLYGLDGDAGAECIAQLVEWKKVCDEGNK